jgi:two-component sensor histidine kinase/outer membrane protein assembly factor BamB
MNKSIILTFCIWLLAGVVCAQHPVFKQLTKQNGLPSNTVYSSLQDKQGYLWLGTEKGLVRFDGYAYKTYTHPAFTGQAVTDLQLDGKGRVWCQNFIGQHFFVLNDTCYYPSQIKNAGNFTTIVIDSEGYVYINADYTVQRLNSNLQPVDTFNVKHQLTDPLLFNKKYTFIELDTLWQYTNKRRVILSSNLARNPENARVFSFKIGNAIYMYAKPASQSFVYQVFPVSKVVPLMTELGGAVIQTVSVTNDSLVWINTTQGVFVLDKHLKPLPFEQPLFKQFSISSVMRDKNGAYWITTLGKGVLYLPQLKALQFQVGNELFSRSCLYKNNSLLVGGNSGLLYALNSQKSQLNSFLQLKFKQQVSAICYDVVSDNLLVASGNLSIYKKEKFIGLLNGAVKEIKKVDTETYLFAASGFVGLICLANSTFSEKWKHRLKAISSNSMYQSYRLLAGTESLRNISITTNKEGSEIYVGTSKGLLQIKAHSEQFLHHQNQPIIATDLEWIGQQLYISTENKGVLKLTNGKLLSITSIETKVGRVVYRLKQANEKLYILSENGAFEFNPIKNTITSIVTGLSEVGAEEYRDLEINETSVYLIGSDLVKVLPLTQILNQTHGIELEIKHVYSNNIPISASQLNSLSTSENNITVDFNLPWLNLNDKLFFYYKINEGNWLQVPGGERQLSLFSLAPNSYRIHIKAESISGFISNTTTTSFVILPPIWERWWFYLLVMISLISLFYVVYLYRIKQLNARNKLLADNMALEANLQRSMLSSIKAQMNPHFIFNALNTIQSYIYLNDKTNASRFLAKFSLLTRKILDMSNTDMITLEAEISALNLYLELEKMRFEDSFEYRLITGVDVQPKLLQLPAMIIQPYVENAIKHGLLHKDSNRKLTIEFKLHEDAVQVVIDDNGIGRKRSAEINASRIDYHQSFSTQANQKRLEILMIRSSHKLVVDYIDKVDSYGFAVGTTVLLSIPVQHVLVN